jgi:hypothetical protein
MRAHLRSAKMKTLITALIFFCGIVWSASAGPQQKQLMAVYKGQGDDLFVPLYWLPETRQTVVKHIPDHNQWVGFESGLWKKIAEDKKLVLLDELGTELDRMDGDELDAFWKRVIDWQRISSQLALLAGFLDQDEGFLDLAYSDPITRPAFQWIIDRRPTNFDTKHIGSTLASGETASFYPHLVEHLLNSPERERLECFSRLLARIAETKPAEQAGARQPATAPESKPDGSDKPQPDAEGRSR